MKRRRTRIGGKESKAREVDCQRVASSNSFVERRRTTEGEKKARPKDYYYFILPMTSLIWWKFEVITVCQV